MIKGYILKQGKLEALAQDEIYDIEKRSDTSLGPAYFSSIHNPEGFMLVVDMGTSRLVRIFDCELDLIHSGAYKL